MNIVRNGQVRWLPQGDVIGQKNLVEQLFGTARANVAHVFSLAALFALVCDKSLHAP